MILEYSPEFKSPCGRLWDADGVEVQFVQKCNTETGEITRIATDPINGVGKDKLLLNEKRDELVRINETRKAPLRFECRNHDWRATNKGKWCAFCGVHE